MYNVEDAQFIKHQALAMEKEQIVESHLVGQEVMALYATTGKSSQTSIQYYNKTYHSVESNEMIDHIGDANKMVDVEKLAEEEFSDNQLKDMYSYEDAIRFRGKLSYARKGFIEGYNKAKETLYTEEQVREAYEYGSNASLGVSKTNLIQSLKQPKQ